MQNTTQISQPVVLAPDGQEAHPAPNACFDVNTQQGFKAFISQLFASQLVARTRAAAARAASAARWFAGAPEPEALSDEDRTEMDMARHRWKESGGPDRDHEARAIAIQLGSRRYS